MTVVLSSLLFEFIYLFSFIFGCAGSLLLCTGFIQLQQARATFLCSTLASPCGSFSCCGAQALGTWISVALRHRCVWNLPKTGIEPVSPALAVDFYPQHQQGSLGFITWFSHSFHSSSISCVLEISVFCSFYA